MDWAADAALGGQVLEYGDNRDWSVANSAMRAEIRTHVNRKGDPGGPPLHLRSSNVPRYTGSAMMPGKNT
jgi:hypothetical protein